MGIDFQFPDRITPLVARTARGAINAHIAIAATHGMSIRAGAKGATGNGFEGGPACPVGRTLNLIVGSVCGFPINHYL